MKLSKHDIKSTARSLPEIRFEKQTLTSFAGIVVFQRILQVLRFKERFRKSFSHLRMRSVYGPNTLFMVLVVHLLLGWRRLRDMDYYRFDPMVTRAVGLRRLPDVSTLSRFLKSVDERTVKKIDAQVVSMVAQRLAIEQLPTVTLDYDGSVLSTKGRGIEGTAVGFNKEKKGSRSYYPIFCTVAQLGQVLKARQRAGNVHDSNGAVPFIQETVETARKASPRSRLEVRMDSAHFNDVAVSWLAENQVEFSISVPFARFVELKAFIEERKRWRKIDGEWSFFELLWRPKKWKRSFRFLFYRRKLKKQRKGPIQLNFFTPAEFDYEYKVVLTNKSRNAGSVLHFHNGRGSQEGLFAELKTQCQLGYIPTRRKAGNAVWMYASILAHNIHRELQIRINGCHRHSTTKRRCAYLHEQLDTFRKKIIQRAGRLTKPSGVLTLTISASKALGKEIIQVLQALGHAA